MLCACQKESIETLDSYSSYGSCTERLFEDDPQATSSQIVRQLSKQQATFEVLQFVCLLVLRLLLWTTLCELHCGLIRWSYGGENAIAQTQSV